MPAPPYSLEVASGPLFRFGRLDITTRTAEPALVRNTTIRPGELTRRRRPLIRRLNATGYFSSVQASIDPTPRIPTTHDPARRDRRRRAARGAAIDRRSRANFSYRDVDVDSSCRCSRRGA
jgi:hypothetical protein